jgi:hypothetical protein
MSTDPKPAANFDAATAELILTKAGQVAHQLGLPRADVPDINQDIARHVWPRLARHDPARLDREAFVRMLVAHATATALRGHRRRRRRAPASLDAMLRGNRIDEPADARGWPAPEDHVGLALDLSVFLAALPRRLRRVANALKTDSVAAAARKLRLSRAEVYRRMRELREHLSGLRP